VAAQLLFDLAAIVVIATYSLMFTLMTVVLGLLYLVMTVIAEVLDWWWVEGGR
jgi:hypothetical protein